VKEIVLTIVATYEGCSVTQGRVYTVTNDNLPYSEIFDKGSYKLCKEVKAMLSAIEPPTTAKVESEDH
jgi:hypothetical protein